MTVWGRWARHPQSLWVRKALFQVHLWTGIGVGIYVFVISVTGSAIVFRNEFYRAFSPATLILTGTGARLTEKELRAAAKRAYPEYEVAQLWKGRNPDAAVEIWLERRGGKKQRIFHPYTGRDLGESVPRAIRLVSWLIDLHDNLLYGQTGRLVNGVGAVFLTLLCVTGAVIWWPGTKSWRRSLGIRWQVNWRRFNWDLHSAIGFWSVVLLLMWALTGIYFAFPEPFVAVVDFFEPPDEASLAPRHGDGVLRWFVSLHFGRFAGWPVKVLWVVLGLVPPALFVTGALMWWNRVLRSARGSLTDG